MPVFILRILNQYL